MNRSGECVYPAAHFHKIESKHVIVVYDELDLPFGVVRVKFSGGPGGHNGIKDIIRVLGPDFLRVRIGIGRPTHKGTEADYVLSNFRSSELKELEFQIETACDAIEALICEGLELAQMKFNQKSPLAKPK